MLEPGSVRVSYEAGIATVEFEHPRSNSLPGALLRELASTITAAGARAETRVIVLKSGGEKAFCAGASFDELLAVRDLEAAIQFFSGFSLVLNAIRCVPQFVIGRVHGKAVGGGVGIVAACDYAIASSNAAVRLSEYALGFGPFVIGPAVERKIGCAAFSALAIRADWVDVAWAERHGLYTEVVENTAALDQKVAALATTLSTASLEATTELKKILWAGTEQWPTVMRQRAETTSRLALTEFAQVKIRSQR